MFKAFLVAVVFAAAAEPAAYTITVTDPAGTPVVLKVDGKEVKSGVEYRVPAFVGEKELSYSVTWVENGVKVTHAGFFTVKAGYVSELEMTVPREFIVHRRPAD